MHASSTDGPPGRLPPILLLFIGSGCAALIYEIVWFQVLQLVIGASAVSLAVLLGTFMGGMFAGSLLLARYVSARGSIRCGSTRSSKRRSESAAHCSSCVMPLVGRLYTAVDGGGPSSVVLRALVSVVLLLPPAMLHGRDAARDLALRRRDARGRRVARALLRRQHSRRGDRLSVRRLLPAARRTTSPQRLWRRSRSTRSLQAPLPSLEANAVHAAASLASREGAAHDQGRGRSWKPRGVYIAIALSGFTALGAEVVWTRLLSLLFGATTYTFSMILAVFLAGLGIGSAIGAGLVRRRGQCPRAAGLGAARSCRSPSRMAHGW